MSGTQRQFLRNQQRNRRTVIHNAIRAGERAAQTGQPMVVPDIYEGDTGQSGAWLIGYRNAPKAHGGGQ